MNVPNTGSFLWILHEILTTYNILAYLYEQVKFFNQIIPEKFNLSEIFLYLGNI
jgi:hypothetical protein